MARITKAQKEAQAKRDWAIQKAINVMSYDNGIPLTLICELGDKLDQCDASDLAMIIASEYSPEGRITWQEFMRVELPLMTNYIAA
jgi:hypothetical protein